MIIGIIIIWLLCSVVAFLLFCLAWLSVHAHLTRGDVAFLGMLSASGPVSLLSALAVVVIDCLSGTDFWDKKVWPR